MSSDHLNQANQADSAGDNPALSAISERNIRPLTQLRREAARVGSWKTIGIDESRRAEIMSANEPARNWWLMELRCLCAFGLGLAVLVWPNLTWLMLVSIFSVYLLADGLLAVIASLTRSKGSRLRWRLLIEGLVGISAGGLAVLAPGLTALARLYLLAIWAILTGPVDIVAALGLRTNSENEGRLAWTSILSFVVGGALVIWSETSALTLVWLMESHILAFGLMLLGLGLRLWNEPWSVHLMTVQSSRVEVGRLPNQPRQE